ncbi:multicopper oxidase family protein [Maliponia aquimaris]|nr:multicopper oxidase family protein [Maliponia aquimaris]
MGQEPDTRVLADPPRLAAETGDDALSRLTALAPASGEVVFDLGIEYVTNQIWDPVERRYDQVRLRGYTGDGIDPKAPYVGPSIYARPGDTVRVRLDNRLPEDLLCDNWDRSPNIPHCFNTTNLHSHGLWVNPTGNSDNVLLSISPGVTFEYEYNIPPDHPAGTFWYHPHRHGSTALQVGSGMAGALVLTGDRAPTPESNGDIDVLLRPTETQPFRERLMVFLQVPYACTYTDANGNSQIRTDPDTGRWICPRGSVGTIESYDQFGPGSWDKSGRFTSINGHVLPTLAEMRTGEIERLRMIHAGVRDTIRLQFLKRDENAPQIDDMSLTDSDSYIGQHCTGEPVDFHLIAADGLTTGRAMRTTDAVFQPGYRWDALVVFDTPGTYCAIDERIAASAAVDGAAQARKLLGFIEVEGAPIPDFDADAHLTAELAAAARINMPADMVDTVVADLENGLSLARFVPHHSLAGLSPETTEIGEQHLTFFIDTSQSPLLFMIDGKPYEPGRIDRQLPLGAVEDWTLTSDFVSHPFHIHVNPFQILEILDPNGRDVSAAGAVDDCCTQPGEAPDPQFAGLKGVWKDTLWVKNAGAMPDGTPARYTMRVRTQYRRYIGEFVLHCHILDHEDQGMMQNIEIVLPQGHSAAHGNH